MTPTEKLAHFITGFSLKDIDESVSRKAVDCIIDTMGVAIGAANDEEITRIYDALLYFNSDERATVWGKSKKASLYDAALVNAMMGHTFELDDVHKRSKCHAGTVVVPAAITLGEFLNSSGEEVLEAVILGYETAVRIGMGFGVTSHRLKGWHVTSTAGTFGASAAASKLLKLNSDQVTSALGLAGTQSSGVWAFTSGGATNKKFHPGHAAVCGIISAILASSGMKSSPNILEAEDGGLFKAMSDQYDYDKVTNALGAKFEFTDLDIKPYACCRSMHPAINAVLNIMDKTKLDIENIERIEIKTYLIAIKQCGFTSIPKNVSEAKFCLPYGVAIALFDKQVLVEQFTDERIKDKKVLDLAQKVVLIEDAEFNDMYPNKWGCELSIWMKDGEKFVERVDNAKGDPLNPLSREEISNKFVSLSSSVIGSDKALAVLERLMDIKNIKNVAQITNLLISEA